MDFSISSFKFFKIKKKFWAGGTPGGALSGPGGSGGAPGAPRGPRGWGKPPLGPQPRPGEKGGPHRPRARPPRGGGRKKEKGPRSPPGGPRAKKESGGPPFFGGPGAPVGEENPGGEVGGRKKTPKAEIKGARAGPPAAPGEKRARFLIRGERGNWGNPKRFGSGGG